ncbi:MAG TPA: chorismate mutase [Candidatus Acidoferrales bacterium]|jgi:monofunctional chorismate mutase|nr:chorismate mutase [Candidatus Acidoferrales bacterium]
MSVQSLRREIDRLDREVVRLLSRRAKYSLAIGRMKQREGLPLFIHKREQEIARNISRANRGPLPDRALKHLYEQLLQHTRAMVRRALRAERRGRKAGLKAGSTARKSGRSKDRPLQGHKRK